MKIVPVTHMDQVLEVSLHAAPEKPHRTRKNAAKVEESSQPAEEGSDPGDTAEE
jgi:hypothetical protein